MAKVTRLPDTEFAYITHYALPYSSRLVRPLRVMAFGVW